MINVMRALVIIIAFLLMPPMVSSQTNPCGMQLGGPAIFCDTFDTPNPGIPSRTGGLHPDVWGVSRTIGDTNMGQGLYNAAPATALMGCNGTTTVLPPNDVAVCNGQLRESTNDNPTGAFESGGVTALAMYPKQPFDFAGRTGTVSFNVSNDTHGSHAAWPEFWMSDTPVPVPFNHSDSWQSLPQHGFGVRFGAAAEAGGFGLCPNTNNIRSPRWTVDSAVVVRNYVMEDVDYQGFIIGTPSNPPIHLNILDCVIAPPDNSGIMNHVELRVSQSLIEVWASDAGATSLRKIATVTNANLSFTRGLIWLEDVHYNADKGGSPSQKQHTFVWDNVAFDGPFTYRDFSFDALDANAPVNNYAPNLANNLGKISGPGQASSWNVLNMPANPMPSAVRVLFNFFHYDRPTTLNVTVNGHARAVAWPYFDTRGFTWRTLAVLIPVTDLIAGTNVVQIGADQSIIASNINIVLVNVPGGVPVLPGSNNAYPTSGPPPPPVQCTVTIAPFSFPKTQGNFSGAAPFSGTCQ